MNIVVAGCGKIGSTIISSLVAEGNDVVALDDSRSVIEEITNIYDVMGICGNCADCDALEEAGIDKAELYVAVTDSDELNMLSCFIAKKMGAKHTIARIRNPEYNDRSLGFMRQQLGLSMSLNPELLAARELFNILKLPSAVKVESFSRRNEMIEMRLKEGSSLDGVKLSDLRSKYNTKVLICVVQRGEKVYIPDGNFVLRSGDKIAMAAAHQELQKLLKSIGMLRKQSKNVMILGGSKTAYYLAKMLLSTSGVSVKIIESDLDRCQDLCEKLPKATIIHGDGAQQELLLEEGLRSLDAFVALTGMDEENILISIYAAANSVPKVISKVNRSELALMAERLGLDSIVSTKRITSDILVRYARALENSMGSNVETLYKIMDGRAEALELNVHPEARITDVPIKDLHLKRDILIAGIVRGRKLIIPGGDDVILPGDKVVVISKDQRLQDLSDILR